MTTAGRRAVLEGGLISGPSAIPPAKQGEGTSQPGPWPVFFLTGRGRCDRLLLTSHVQGISFNSGAPGDLLEIVQMKGTAHLSRSRSGLSVTTSYWEEGKDSQQKDPMD